MKIDDEHVLPCDFVVGHMRFGKGVKLETVRKAAERWLKVATDAYFKPDPKKVAEIDRMLADLHNDIEFFKNLPDDEATTIAGLVIHEARLIPEPGEQFEFHDVRFTILDKQGNQVTRLRAEKLPQPESESQEDEG